MNARRTSRPGTSAAAATASSTTPSSAPCRSSPVSSRTRKCCSSSVAAPSSAGERRRRAGPSTRAGRARRGRSSAASTAATVSDGSAAGAPRRPRQGAPADAEPALPRLAGEPGGDRLDLVGGRPASSSAMARPWPCGTGWPRRRRRRRRRRRAAPPHRGSRFRQAISVTCCRGKGSPIGRLLRRSPADSSLRGWDRCLRVPCVRTTIRSRLPGAPTAGPCCVTNPWVPRSPGSWDRGRPGSQDRHTLTGARFRSSPARASIPTSPSGRGDCPRRLVRTRGCRPRARCHDGAPSRDARAAARAGTGATSRPGSNSPSAARGTAVLATGVPWWVPAVALALVGIVIALVAVWPEATGPTVPDVSEMKELAGRRSDARRRPHGPGIRARSLRAAGGNGPGDRARGRPTGG